VNDDAGDEKKPLRRIQTAKRTGVSGCRLSRAVRAGRYALKIVPTRVHLQPPNVQRRWQRRWTTLGNMDFLISGFTMRRPDDTSGLGPTHIVYRRAQPATVPEPHVSCGKWGYPNGWQFAIASYRLAGIRTTRSRGLGARAATLHHADECTDSSTPIIILRPVSRDVTRYHATGMYATPAGRNSMRDAARFPAAKLRA